MCLPSACLCDSSQEENMGRCAIHSKSRVRYDNRHQKQGRYWKRKGSSWEIFVQESPTIYTNHTKRWVRDQEEQQPPLNNQRRGATTEKRGIS